MRAIKHLWRVKTVVLIIAIILLGSVSLSQAAITGKYGSEPNRTPTLRKNELPQAVSLKPGAFDLPKIKYNNTKDGLKELSAAAAKKVEAKQEAPQAQVAHQTSTTKTTQKSSARRTTRSSAAGGERDRANAILASLIRRYPILKGTYIVFGPTPNGNKYQAVAYYTIGKIVINPNHTAPLSSIIYHECMHIKDWREDHKIDNNDSW